MYSTLTLLTTLSLVFATPTPTEPRALALRQDTPSPSPTPLADGTLSTNLGFDWGDWNYKGCWIDNEFGRVISFRQDDIAQPITVESCAYKCLRLGYDLAGLEYSNECWCGNKLYNDARLADSDNECNMSCNGDATEACGAGNRLSIYSGLDELPVIPVAKPEESPAEGWTYEGCKREQDPRVLPNRIFLGLLTTPELCVSNCESRGYTAAGLQYGFECWCGTLEQAETAVSADESDCWAACTGDEQYICGGSSRFSLYTQAPEAK